MKKSSLLSALPLFLLAAPAFAHTNGHASGFWNGLAHPFTGLDHLVVMCLLGAWFASLSRLHVLRSLGACAIFFACAVLLGSQISSAYMALVEWAILGSAVLAVLLMGTAKNSNFYVRARRYCSASPRNRFNAAAPVIAACVISGHGIAHGMEVAGHVVFFTAGATTGMIALVSINYWLFGYMRKLALPLHAD